MDRVYLQQLENIELVSFVVFGKKYGAMATIVGAAEPIDAST